MKIKKFSDIPKGIENDFYLEFFSNTEAVLTGDTEITELEESVLKIKNKDAYIKFSGENLKIIYYSSTGIRINGKITSVEFE